MMARKRMEKGILSAEFHERMGKVYRDEARYWRDNNTQFDGKSDFVKGLEDKAVYHAKLSQHHRVQGFSRNQMKS
jgi:SET domain-containing protein